MSASEKLCKLREIVEGDRLEFLMEAHNGISAKIVQEAGFRGIWAGGLAISAALGVRDNNEASWTQVLEILEFMSDATEIPILMDGDTGYGNFNNMRRVVQKLEQREIAGICIEDKVFPKTNSFLRGETQPLASIDEFCGKIKAGKDAVRNNDFVFVARVEALIAGWGLPEALKRAEAYRDAGADAILMHSKQQNPDEILEFLDEWSNRLPVVLVPTTYYSTPTGVFRSKSVSVIIWANHLIRGATDTMRHVAHTIARDESVAGIEDSIVPISEIFRLQGDDELKEAEKRYMSASGADHSATILAATRGSALETLTAEIPKTLLKVGGTSLLERIIGDLRKNLVKDIKVVAGYKKEKIDLPGITIIANDTYAETGEAASLDLALGDCDGNTLILFGDVLFRRYIASLLLNDESDVAIVVDGNFDSRENDGKPSDYVIASRGSSEQLFLDRDVILKKAIFGPPEEEYDGEWFGMMKLSGVGVGWVKELLHEARGTPTHAKMQIVDILNQLTEGGKQVKVHYIEGGWIEVDSLVDLNQAQDFQR